MVMESILMAGNLNEFKIDDTLSVFAESLEKDMVVLMLIIIHLQTQHLH
jgi:hypothetical protein